METFSLIYWLLIAIFTAQFCNGVELAIEFPISNLSDPSAIYRQDFTPPIEEPKPGSSSSSNFTTRPYPPGKFTIWYRNETTLFVTWKSPVPSGIFTHYKVQIEPPDAIESVKEVVKEGQGYGIAAFNDLIPGRAYNITAQTVSGDQVSVPSTAQYRTLPLQPGNITLDSDSLTTHSLRIQWLPPNGTTEFDGYEINIQQIRNESIITIPRDMPQVATFNHLEPEHTYTIVVQTFSGKISSQPTSANVTTRALPEKN